MKLHEKPTSFTVSGHLLRRAEQQTSASIGGPLYSREIEKQIWGDRNFGSGNTVRCCASAKNGSLFFPA
jgi:hypothetical protein